MLSKFSKVAVLLGVTLVALVGYTQMQQRARVYNPATEVTVNGVVDDVVQNQGKQGGAGTHIMLKSGADLLAVHLGPSAFLAKNNFTLAKGDQVEVTGSKVQLDGKDVVIAREVKKGASVLTLRDSAGIPKWRGSPNR